MKWQGSLFGSDLLILSQADLRSLLNGDELEDGPLICRATQPRRKRKGTRVRLQARQGTWYFAVLFSGAAFRTKLAVPCPPPSAGYILFNEGGVFVIWGPSHVEAMTEKEFHLWFKDEQEEQTRSFSGFKFYELGLSSTNGKVSYHFKETPYSEGGGS